ncbi:uncharacterized protein LOC123536318 [Mercenaria mercenaria]|uniref:uncharacterized protein LOC123536318 n=1 Tax=Mercenaria mercenaria TaxID=6596 RepID=UPI001E1E1F60|nr:uncharacterized protein LOC123536318 [Mercenaria mercenaria]XP_045175353.1 uncharacterized protein LOC123536318 [Mercenaria mercenaria]XP_045175354.1 uncharacterized protein LOC123536318 [Mercenaria mercenaria]
MASSANLFSPSEKQKCQEVVRILQQETLLAVDCEGVQLGKDGPLTLLQIGTLNGTVYLFDVMKNEQEQDKSFFKDSGLDGLLTSSEIVKVIHSCSEDSAALFHQFGIKLENVFDTQVAHLVIEEHKGRKLPSREKLEEICKMYSAAAGVYARKDDVQLEYVKNDGNFWAKRPLSQEMIDYASGDVAALLPEVYDNQNRYLDENKLMDKFYERVKEEIEIEIDPVNKEKRKDRQTKIKNEILTSMSKKYKNRTELADLTVDEKRALNETSLTDISSAKHPEVIRELKLEFYAEYLKSLEEELKDPCKFHPKPHILFKLNEISFQGTRTMRRDGTIIKKLFIKILSDDIERKYYTDTPVTQLSRCEYKILQNLRPLYDDIPYPETVLALHWRIIADDLDEDMEKLTSDPEHEVNNVPRLIRFIRDVRVPEYIKSKAREVRKSNEDAILERLPHKYDLNSNADDLTEAEKIVLDRLDVIYNDYDPIVEFLHWEVTYFILCKEFEDFKSGKFTGKDYMSRKLDFLSTNEQVPDKIKEKSKEFQKEMSKKKERRKQHNK